MKEPEIDPAVEAAKELKFFTPEYDGGVVYNTSIIRSTCEKLTEPLLATIADARSVIESGVELMTTEQVGKWSGVRSWLEQAPYSESRAASVLPSEPCFISGESSRICELGTKSCEIKHKKGGDASCHVPNAERQYGTIENATTANNSSKTSPLTHTSNAAPTVQSAGAAYEPELQPVCDFCGGAHVEARCEQGAERAALDQISELVYQRVMDTDHIEQLPNDVQCIIDAIPKCEQGAERAAENWSRESVKEAVANYQVARWQRREKAARAGPELGAVSWVDALAQSWERRAGHIRKNYTMHDSGSVQTAVTFDGCAKELRRAYAESSSTYVDQP